MYIKQSSPKKLDTPKALELKPLGKKEIPRYISIISILFQLPSNEERILYNFMEHFLKTWNKSGIKFAIQYYSECFRLIGIYLAGEGSYNNSTWVKHYDNGIPKCIGYKGKILIEELLASLILKEPVKPIHRALISIMAVFRACSPKHEIKFKTVTDPFKGVSQTLDPYMLKLAIRHLGVRISQQPPKFFWSSKTGVNAQFAFISAGLDLLAIIRTPKVWVSIVLYSFKCKFYKYLFIFILNSIILLPVLPFSLPIDLYLGRLAIIKELRGKARVIGITDQWTQWLFKPLHDSIYKNLDKLTEDGTRDQLNPVNELLRVHSKAISVDLSAATDRLPVILQKDILNILNVPGDLWLSILNRDYYYDNDPYHYAVGQPMGAYSSFAMLALTNHVIMYYAYLLSFGKKLPKDTGLYAILGDDVVISDYHLASAYTWIMHSVLGVEINPIKGFTGSLVEFAKNWFWQGVNLTPIGSKSILRSIRKPIFFVSVLKDYLKKECNQILKLELSVLINYLEKLFGKTNNFNKWKWLFSMTGPQSGFWNTSKDNPNVYLWKVLFDEVLKLVGGVRFEEVTEFYFYKIKSSTKLTHKSIRDLALSYFKLFNFIRYPLIWNPKKLSKIELEASYAAVLTSATIWSLSFPLLLVIFTRSLLWAFFLWFLSWLFLIFNFHFYILYRDLWNYSKLNNPRLFRFLVSKFGGLHFFLTMPPLFSQWMLEQKTLRPVQLLTERVKSRSDDDLPAVKTADKFLCSVNSEYSSYQREIKITLKKTYKVRKKRSNRGVTKG